LETILGKLDILIEILKIKKISLKSTMTFTISFDSSIENAGRIIEIIDQESNLNVVFKPQIYFQRTSEESLMQAIN
jgi:hypothetical protein